MMLTMLPVTALAAEEGDANNTATLTATDGAPVPGASDNGIENVVNDTGDSQDTGANADANDTDDTNPTAGNDGAGENNTTGGENGTDESNPVGGENGTGESNPTGGETSAPVTPPAETFTAKIGNVKYDTLDAAINAAQDGATIEIGKDCTLTVGMLTKAVVINGNDKTITIPEQNTENHALNINASLTFNKANVVFTNENAEWTVTMSSEGVLTLDERSTCIMEKHGIYADNYATINVKSSSKLTVQNTSYTALMADEGFANLNIEEGSTVVVDRAYRGDGVPNGINNFKINVVNSTLNVTKCENQGLVRCWLTLDHSNAEISGNDMGITGYADTDVLTMKNGATLLIKDNAHSGIFMYGGNVDVQDGTALTITGTGNSVSDEVVEGYYVGALAIRTAEPANANVKFADNATVNLIDNAVSAIRNCGTIEIGADTVIKNNGSKTKYGGGIRNYGEITVSAGAQLYNNHALNAGDDIYNGTYKYKTYTCDGRITFAPVGENWVLDDCKDPIVGWYQDGSEMLTDTDHKRWNGDATDENYYADEYTVGKEAVSDALALKAAHGKFCNVTYEVTGDIPSDAGAAPAPAKVKMGGSYTVAPAQTTSQSRYTFSGWRIDGTGDIVTSLENLRQDVKLVGVWSYRSGGGSSGGGGGRKPTVDIPDDVPTGLNGDDHFAYIVGYPDGNVKPGSSITRAEAMTLVNRVLNRLPEKSEDLLDDMIKWPDNADASVWYYLAVQEATNSHDYSDKSDADKYEKWTKIRDARDWTLLEK